MSARHIAVVTTSYPTRPGDPAGHFVASECRAWVSAGNRVTVVTPCAPAPGAEFENLAISVVGVGGNAAFGWPGALERLRQNPLRAFDALSFCLNARKALARLDADEIVAHWLLPSLLVVDGHSAPITAVAHGSDVALLKRLPGRLLRPLVSRWLDQQVRFRFVAERLRGDLVHACGAALGTRLLAQSRVEPCALDLANVPGRAEARTGLGVGDRFIAVCVGRLVSTKRVDWALTHAPVPPGTRWVVVGDGPERARLEAAFPTVEFTGALPRERALGWISAADVLVCSSESEGAPTVVREARGIGTLVWTSDVGDVRRWAENDPGIVVMDQLSPRSSQRRRSEKAHEEQEF